MGNNRDYPLDGNKVGRGKIDLIHQFNLILISTPLRTTSQIYSKNKSAVLKSLQALVSPRLELLLNPAQMKQWVENIDIDMYIINKLHKQDNDHNKTSEKNKNKNYSHGVDWIKNILWNKSGYFQLFIIKCLR